MRWRPAGADWRAVGAVALAVVGACLALGLVPHGVGGYGYDVVVTDPGPPPSVDATYDEPRKRYRNRVANRLVQFAPATIPVVGGLVGFAMGRGRQSSGAGATVASVAVGAFAGAAVGYALFVGVASHAYAEIPGGYVLESYPPQLAPVGVLSNALGVGAGAAVGGGVASAAAVAFGDRGDAR